MGHEEIVISSDVGQLGPFLRHYRIAVQVVDPGVIHRQQEGRVGGDDELTVVEAGRILYEAGQLHLEFRGHAVFRLVQQIDLITLDFVGEVHQGALAVGLLRQVVYQAVSDIS
jgi:hypothetical protein